MTNCSLSGRGQSHAMHSRILHSLKYIWNGWSYSRQIVCRLCQMLASGRLIIPERGVTRDPFENFTPLWLSGMSNFVHGLVGEVLVLCPRLWNSLPVDVQSAPSLTNYPQVGVVKVMWRLNFLANKFKCSRKRCKTEINLQWKNTFKKTLKVIHRLQAFSNAIHRTFVQHFTRFELTVCLRSLCISWASRGRLRSSTSSLLYIRPSRPVTVGDRSFATAGPRLWNSLPVDVQSAPSLTTFRHKLKTHLFRQSYPDIVL